ncbi:MAG: hypothetical protein AB1505_30520 [Candidatus Latescibacterota bacterium]
MWLGFAAAFTGVAYAVLKFLTVLHLRQLHDQVVQVGHETQKVTRRAEGLHEKLEMEESRRRALEREVGEMRRSVQRLADRLQSTLPPLLLPQLAECRALGVEPDTPEGRLLGQLDLAGEVAQAMGSFSLLLLQLPARADTDQTLAVAALTQRWVAAGVHFHGPEAGRLTALFRTPVDALESARSLVPALLPEAVAGSRGALQAGMQLPEEKAGMRRTLARALRQAEYLLARAPAGSLLLNQAAYRALGAPPEFALTDAEEGVWAGTLAAAAAPVEHADE